jgi:hypothetical protein
MKIWIVLVLRRDSWRKRLRGTSTTVELKVLSELCRCTEVILYCYTVSLYGSYPLLLYCVAVRKLSCTAILCRCTEVILYCYTVSLYGIYPVLLYCVAVRKLSCTGILCRCTEVILYCYTESLD